MTDLEMLAKLAASDALDDKSREAFGDMRRRIVEGRQKDLTALQREWAEAAAAKLELDSDEAANLVSTGAVPPVDRLSGTRHYEQMARPFKPPGRRGA